MNIKLKDILKEARIYRRDLPGTPPSTEYSLTPEEEDAIKSMTPNQRRTFMTKKLKQSRKERGLCSMCGGRTTKKPDGTPAVYCPDCLKKHKDYRERKIKELGVCVRCLKNKPEAGKKVCQVCDAQIQARRDKAIASGICIKCYDKPAEDGLQVCKDCAKTKTDIEKLRRTTNPESEKLRIQKRDTAYRLKKSLENPMNPSQ